MLTFRNFLEIHSLHGITEVVIKNPPGVSGNRINLPLEEGKEKLWKKGYTYRLDRRPENQGGDQIHVFDRKGQAWAYRHNGQRSEPSKYTHSPTNIVKDIISDLFGIDRSDIEEVKIAGRVGQKLMVEIKITAT